MGDDYLPGSAEEAAAAIQSIMDGGQSAPTRSEEGNEDEVAAQIEAKSVPAAEEAEEQPNTGEEAAPAETPAAPSKEETPTPVITKAPEPAPAAPKAADEQGKDRLTATTEKLNQLNAIVPRIAARIDLEFGDIKTYDDRLRVASEDPQRYQRFTIMQEQLQTAENLQSQASSEYRALWSQAEGLKLASIPEFADPVKGPELEQSIRAYAKKAFGYTDEQIRQAGSSDIIMAHKAMLWDNHIASEKEKAVAHAKALKEAEEKAKNAPPVQKPGVARDADKGTEKIKELDQRFQKTGKVTDLAALLEARG